MAGRSFQGGKTCGESNMKERARWQREKFVVGLNEQVTEVDPSLRRVESLYLLARMWKEA